MFKCPAVTGRNHPPRAVHNNSKLNFNRLDTLAFTPIFLIFPRIGWFANRKLFASFRVPIANDSKFMIRTFTVNCWLQSLFPRVVRNEMQLSQVRLPNIQCHYWQQKETKSFSKSNRPLRRRHSINVIKKAISDQVEPFDNSAKNCKTCQKIADCEFAGCNKQYIFQSNVQVQKYILIESKMDQRAGGTGWSTFFS